MMRKIIGVNMTNISYEIIDTNDAKSVEEYEKGLYKAFMSDKSSWIANNYTIIDNKRLQPYIPYHDQVIYGIKENNKLIFSIAVNLNNNKQLQLEKKGFAIEKDNSVCEGINLFSVENLSGDAINYFVNIGNLIVDDLKSKNKKLVYATAPRKVKSLYQFLGFTVINRMKVDGEIKYLLVFDLYNIRIDNYDL